MFLQVNIVKLVFKYFLIFRKFYKRLYAQSGLW